MTLSSPAVLDGPIGLIFETSNINIKGLTLKDLESNSMPGLYINEASSNSTLTNLHIENCELPDSTDLTVYDDEEKIINNQLSPPSNIWVPVNTEITIDGLTLE